MAVCLVQDDAQFYHNEANRHLEYDLLFDWDQVKVVLAGLSSTFPLCCLCGDAAVLCQVLIIQLASVLW